MAERLIPVFVLRCRPLDVDDRWTDQFKDIATADRSTFQELEMLDGNPVKDLDDLLKIGGDSYRRNAKLIDGVMRF
jgi:hypothetical protein